MSAITDAELAAVKLFRCGDASCIFGAQGTSDTDAGCRCLTQRSDADAIKFMRVAFLARGIAAERDRLRGLLVEMRNEAEWCAGGGEPHLDVFARVGRELSP